MHEKLISRLQNWKFLQALPYLDGEPDEVQHLVHALARLLGDCGWGLDGDLATVIEAALDSVLTPPAGDHGAGRVVSRSADPAAP